ncbi:MAG: sulfite oxidase [Chloroflexi bacterium]|nr:sulfite oxidase [Chloroflexota bacterium]
MNDEANTPVEVGDDDLRLTAAKGVSRREFLAMGATVAALGAASCVAPAAPATPTALPPAKETPRPLSVLPSGQRRIIAASPPVYETPLDQVQGLITPTPLFFLRNHVATPIIDVKTWRLKVEGSAVEKPMELTFDDLLNLPSRSQLSWVECAGNGRSFFDKFGGKVAQGGQWRLGGISVAEWTGVPLSEVLKKAGVKSNAVDVLLEGLDQAKVGRPIPIKAAMEPHVMLAYSMNGESLPPDHGFPVRAIVPGWIGVANIKWLGHIAVEDKPVKTRFNTDLYIMKGPDYPYQPSLSLQNIKSAVALPWEATLKAGSRIVRGFAWSAYGKIAKVEHSLDGGKTWKPAVLLEPNTPFVWARWEFPWQAAPGNHTIMIRATDEKGNAQPDKVPWNEQGYLYNAVISHPVKVE